MDLAREFGQDFTAVHVTTEKERRPRNFGGGFALLPGSTFARMPAGDNSAYAAALAYSLIVDLDAGFYRYCSVKALRQAVATAAESDPPSEDT